LIIRSKFKDYYDIGLGLGQDKSIVYNRSYQKIELPPKHIKVNASSPERLDHLPCSNYLSYHFQVLSFCGKLYPVVRCPKKRYEGDMQYDSYFPIEIWEHSMYSQEDYVASVNRQGKNQKFHRSRKHYGISQLFDLRYLDYFFNPDSWNLDEYHRKYDAPIVLASRKTLEINPNLSDLRFQTQLDPYTAWQMIAMYISGVLGNTESDIVGVDDAHLMRAKGFDERSFKRSKGTPNRKLKGHK